MLNRTDDFLAPSAQVNSRFINSAISPPVLCLKALGSRAGLFDHRNVKSNRLFHLRSKKLLPISYNPGPDGPPLFSEKIPEPRQIGDVVRRQDRADKIRLRRGVNFIQMTLPFAQLHKLPDALVQGTTFADHIGTRAERGANALIVE